MASTVQAAIGYAETNPFNFFLLTLIAAAIWVRLDKGQVETLNFQGRKIAIPALLLLLGAANVFFVEQGFNGLLFKLADSIVTGVFFGLVIMLVGNRDGGLVG